MAEYGARSASSVTSPEQDALYASYMGEMANNPREYFAKLRANGPVDHEHFRDTVALLRREDMEEILRNTDVFSNASPVLGSAEPVIPLNVDPPLHSTYRRVLDPLFSPKKMAVLQPTVARHVNEFIDTFIDKGEIDFSEALSVPLPVSTFLTLLGLPLDEIDHFINWKNILIRPDLVAGGYAEGLELQAKTAMEIYGRFGAEVAARRTEPRDDLMTYFTTAKLDDGQLLTDGEILRILLLLMAAGLDTVTITLQAIFNYLATHPEAQQLIHDDPTQIDNVIEELLRWETPVMFLGRTAKVDTELSGCPIKAGQNVLAVISYGNVAEEVPDSMKLDLTRGDKAHLSFGAGNHRCLGSHLARMELRTVLQEWHKRIPFYSLKPGTKIEWVPSALRGIDHLPLVWETK